MLTEHDQTATQISYVSQAFYGLCQHYGGGPKRRVTQYGPQKWTGGRHTEKPKLQRPDSRTKYRQLRPTLWWMKGEMGWFACKNTDHNVNQKQRREEISGANKNIKRKQLNDLSTSEDNSYTADIFENYDASDHSSSEGEAHWSEQE